MGWNAAQVHAAGRGIRAFNSRDVSMHAVQAVGCEMGYDQNGNVGIACMLCRLRHGREEAQGLGGDEL